MSRKPTLSPSRISTYLACPVRYRWTYVDDRGKWYVRAKSCFSFGNTLHRVLERFHSGEESGVETTEQAMVAYEESWIDAGFSSAEEMAEAFHEGKEILARHIEEHRRCATDGKVLFVEKTLRLDLGAFDLTGRIDRVDERHDGSLEIIDYKTGRESVSEEDVATDIAMGCYQLLLAREFPNRKVSATLVAVRTGAKATASMSAEELDDFEADVRSLGAQILSDMEEAYELTPRLKPLCAQCDFLPLCRRHEEFAEAWDASRTSSV